MEIQEEFTSKAELIRNANGDLEVLATAPPSGLKGTSFQPLQQQEMG